MKCTQKSSKLSEGPNEDPKQGVEVCQDVDDHKDTHDDQDVQVEVDVGHQTSELHLEKFIRILKFKVSKIIKLRSTSFWLLRLPNYFSKMLLCQKIESVSLRKLFKERWFQNNVHLTEVPLTKADSYFS